MLVILGCAVAGRAAVRQIYDDHANARQLVSAALRKASAEHKNVILDFGANWCLDCHVLDAQMHRGQLAGVIARNYEVVHISVGRYDRNLDLAAKYGIPLHKGIPALAVLNSRGKLLVAQKQGEFENARAMNPSSFLAFFEKWKPKR